MLKSDGKLPVFDYANASNVLIKPIYTLYLKTIEHPYGLEYMKETHKQVLENIGFERVEFQKEFLFEMALYQK